MKKCFKKMRRGNIDRTSTWFAMDIFKCPYMYWLHCGHLQMTSAVSILYFLRNKCLHNTIDTNYLVQFCNADCTLSKFTSTQPIEQTCS